MASQAGYATFTIAAKDAASGVMGKIGNSMGKLKSVAGAAFKALAAGAAAAAAAIAGRAIASIKGAMDDEKAQTRMVATLKARGLATKDNIAAIDALITSAQHLGITDDQVRASIETATQYTHKFSDALKINKVAQDLAIAKGIDLETATAMVGKAYSGNGKALKHLGIDLTKTTYVTKKKTVVDKAATDAAHKAIDLINQDRKERHKSKLAYGAAIKTQESYTVAVKGTVKGLDALNLVTKQYGGIAAEVANTTAVRLEDAQIGLNEAFEAFGAKFLPDVANVITWFSTDVLPKISTALDELAPMIRGFIKIVLDEWMPALGKAKDQYIDPIADSIGEISAKIDYWNATSSPAFIKQWGLIDIALAPVTASLIIIQDVLDAINVMLSGKTVFDFNPNVNLGGGLGQPLVLPGAPGRGGIPRRGGPTFGEPVTLQSNDLTVNLGTTFVNKLDGSFGQRLSTGGSRTNP